jgi:hypothetical protein
MEPDFFSRVVAECYVAVANGAASIIGSSGLAESVAYNGAGDVTVKLHAPGEPTLTQKGGIVQATPVSSTIGDNVVATVVDSMHVRVRGSTISGNPGAPVAKDVSFALSVRTVQRAGGDPA